MRFSAVVLATLAIVYGAVPDQSSSEQSMEGFQGAMTNHQQVMDTLNHQLKNGDPHAVSDTLVAYITGADSQIDNAIATIGTALSPLTLGLSQAIADVLLGPFVQSVTNGAEVLVARLIGNGADTMNAALVGQLTGDYSRLAKLSSQYNINTSKLQDLNKQLQNTLPKTH